MEYSIKRKAAFGLNTLSERYNEQYHWLPSEILIPAWANDSQVSSERIRAEARKLSTAFVKIPRDQVEAIIWITRSSTGDSIAAPHSGPRWSRGPGNKILVHLPASASVYFPF